MGAEKPTSSLSGPPHTTTSTIEETSDRGVDAPSESAPAETPVEERPPAEAMGSVPPPPPSKRPEGERPKVAPPNVLPPPLSNRPPLPSRPQMRSSLPTAPRVPKIGAAKPSPEVERLEEELASLRKRLSAQHAETRVEQKNNELLRAELANLKNQVGLLEKQLSESSSGGAAPADSSRPIDSIRPSQWPALQKANSKHAQELERLRAEHRAELDKLRSNHAMELANLKKSLFSPSTTASNDEAAKLSELEAKYEARLDALRKRLRDAEHRNGTERIAELEKPAKQASDAPAGSDDLTRLKGVGPAIARSLKKEGITTFAQIAAWSPDDVEAIAPKIKTTVARIKKNRWIEAARELA